MTPYFFRGSVIITERIISYTEFMQMTVFDFERIEKLYIFKNKEVNNRANREKQKETVGKLSSLPKADISSFGFSKEQLEGLGYGDR